MTIFLALLLTTQVRIEAKIDVDPAKTLATMQPLGQGIGVAVWDQHMVDPEIPKLIENAGYKIVRYPGGSYADIYHWKTGTTTKGMGGTVMPGSHFDSYMAMALKAKAETLITVNYGTNPEGTGGAEPSEAAEWVRYANKTKGYKVKYWEIGNEVYGNGFYNGQGWEADLHAPDSKRKEDRLKNPKLGPTEYGKNVNAFVQAMKAEDPSIKIGAVLTCPGGWPDGVDPDWNSNVLKECGRNIDFVVIHWYGEGKTPVEALYSTDQIPVVLGKLRTVVDRYCGDRAKDVQLWMSEGDGSGLGLRQSGGLFAADFFANWLKYGAATVTWWNLHNGMSVSQTGEPGDQGLLSSGHSRAGVFQPPANTPFPPYYGHMMFNKFARPGDTFIQSTSSRRELAAHAVRRKDGRLALMLINRDDDYEMVAQLGEAFSATGKRIDYTRAGIGREKAFSGKAIAVPPSSITVLVFDRSAR